MSGKPLKIDNGFYTTPVTDKKKIIADFPRNSLFCDYDGKSNEMFAFQRIASPFGAWPTVDTQFYLQML